MEIHAIFNNLRVKVTIFLWLHHKKIWGSKQNCMWIHQIDVEIWFYFYSSRGNPFGRELISFLIASESMKSQRTFLCRRHCHLNLNNQKIASRLCQSERLQQLFISGALALQLPVSIWASERSVGNCAILMGKAGFGLHLKPTEGRRPGQCCWPASPRPIKLGEVFAHPSPSLHHQPSEGIAQQVLWSKLIFPSCKKITTGISLYLRHIKLNGLYSSTFSIVIRNVNPWHNPAHTSETATRSKLSQHHVPSGPISIETTETWKEPQATSSDDVIMVTFHDFALLN